MELHVLHRHGWSISALAREFGLNWRTARRYATAPAPPRYARRCRPAELTPAQLAHVERRLAACPSLRGTVLLRELRELGYSASAASLRRRLRILRPAAMGEPLIRFETGPGIQSQGDWTDCGIWPLGTGSAALHAWVTVLGCSRMVALRFATDKTRATTLSAIVRCVDDLGGATAELLTDRDTALVVGSLPGGAPIFAPEWLDTAALLGTRPRACRPYRAKTKGKVERLNREIKEDFLAWLTGQVLPGRPTLADYDVAARRWALEVVAMRRHRTTGRIVGEAWEVDRVRDAGLQEVQRPAPRPFVVTQLPASIQALEDSVPRRIRRDLEDRAGREVDGGEVATNSCDRCRASGPQSPAKDLAQQDRITFAPGWRWR